MEAGGGGGQRVCVCVGERRGGRVGEWGGSWAGQSGLQREDKPKLVTPFPFHLLVAVVEHGCTHQVLAAQPPSTPTPPIPFPFSTPSPSLSFWPTAQLCCVWIRPRIKQEVEIKQKLSHTQTLSDTGSVTKGCSNVSSSGGLWRG